ncbi:hypothetical protein E3N88_04707 [Mikania micrantha]|uniref:Uncharacterized protein n=1 Tax=Mikania micrantha TaxID=192012 RepID=A0A5N6PV69_9ASTR|nr:hypothetical protein E3N88_04707 [Mikania micrantha]
MAQREDGCCLVRRFAYRGIHKNIGGSRAREDRFTRDRRFADRGNEIRSRDPRDILKIKRLRQRVRDLEIQQEIKRLRQRVRNLELKREMRKTETESSTVVRDEGDGGEQQPFSPSPRPPRFFEPIYPEGVSEDVPIFDEDGSDCDEKECSLLQKLLCAVTVQEDGSSIIVWDECDADSDTVVWDESDNEEEQTTNECLKVRNGDIIAKDGKALSFDTPKITPVCMKALKIVDQITASPRSMQFEILENIGISEDSAKDNGKPCGVPLISKFHMVTLIQIEKEIEVDLDKVACLEPNFMDNSQTLGFAWNLFQNKDGVFKVDQLSIMDIKYVRLQINKGISELIKVTNGHLEIEDLRPSKTKSITDLWVWSKKRISDPFDPGGTGHKLGETTSKVELFQRGMIIITKNRVDVPFDPGGYDSMSKLEDEFFFEEGEYDAVDPGPSGPLGPVHFDGPSENPGPG